MSPVSQIVDGFARWMDVVADTIVASIARLRNVRSVQLVEGDDGSFSLRPREADAAPTHPPFRLDEAAPDLPDRVAAELRGRDIELVLRPGHFLFRPLELPKRAAEFLDGIVRAQIDRLTPWSASEAAFGWTPPEQAAEERIGLTVAATARVRIEPYVQALKAIGAKSIVVYTLPPVRSEDAAAAPAPIRVHEHSISGMLGVARVRQALLAALVAVSVVSALAMAASQILGTELEAQLDALNSQIAAQRLALTRGDQRGETAALRALERRKQERAATVLVIEALARVLPDHSYVTEMHIEGDKLQVIGVSREAPTLIGLMEQSSRFTEATFFAPTTRVPQEPGERFHIEARIHMPPEARP